MRRSFASAALLTCLSALALARPAAGQRVLTFDEIDTGLPGQAPLTAGYGGFTWENAWAVDRDRFDPSGYRNGTVSGDNTVAVYYGVAMVNAAGFNFNSAYLTAAWANNLGLTVRGFRSGVELFTRSLRLDTHGPTLVVFDFENVHRVEFSTDPTGSVPAWFAGGEQVAMDNLTVDGAIVPRVPDGQTPTTVPEPMSMALLGTGLAGVGALRRRRRNPVTA